MKIRNVHISLKQLLALAFYYGFAQFLPGSYAFIVGGGVNGFVINV